ncbi:hypothetical protein [Staphylococcus gallinarum]|uniref:hypothetical protein n=1 Tax=Staphylococcus gallinarum TaxID=1293 RepID=UPI001E310CBB|nr:hypothetical protein [Staphylococcus gallinarum]MCD8920857.1 hypothetical protein [Staphylococcus gallinarum]UEH01122.1 hypothetical protein K3U27_01995 [Staphylococcus gallinarum]
MNYYDLNSLGLTYKNIDILNKYYVENTFFGVAEQFVEPYKITATQIILSIKYSSVTFNIFTSIYYLEQYCFNSNNKYQELINTQSSNFYIQAAYDNLYQLLNFMTLSEEENTKLYNDDQKRYYKEENFRIGKLKRDNKNIEIIQLLEDLYQTKLQVVRKHNNYVKHNGHLEEFEENITKVYPLSFNKSNPLETIEKAMFNVENDIDPLISKAPRGKKVELNDLTGRILEIIEDLLLILDKAMGIYIDDTYRELMRMMEGKID